LRQLYDSGCSFGRELNDERINLLLTDEQEIQKYIVKGLAEIHWKNKKISHFELVRNLLEHDSSKEHIMKVLARIIDRFDYQKVEKIVLSIDRELIDLGNPNILPKERKDLVLKLLTLRLNKLQEIYLQYK
jgi:hypothetical protein